MNFRKFGSTGVSASEMGLGAWQLGGADWGDLDEDTALNILQAAVESGVNFFDTADVYGLGRSETLIGRFLRQCPQRIFVATKLGRFPEPGWPANFSDAAIRQHTEASLRRLGVEALDLTQLHCIPADVMRQGDVFESLRRLRQEGKIRAFGASVESMDEAQLCLQQEGLTSLQIIFNFFRQKPIVTLFDQAREKNVALIIRLPLASGLLAGKYTRTSQFGANDHRTFNRDGAAFNVGETFAGLPFETGVDLVEEIRPLVPEGWTMAQMAMRWILDFDAVSVVIPGASKVEQARGNARVSDLPPLPAELHERLSRFYGERVHAAIRGPY
jgi:aryl-alcohol dehydrogenase-like predicted oxidoreductase